MLFEEFQLFQIRNRNKTLVYGLLIDDTIGLFY